MPDPRVLVVTTVHTPLDARIHARQIRAMREAGWPVTFAAPFTDTGTDPSDVTPGVVTEDLPRAVGRRRLTALRAARQLLRRSGPDHDLVLLHDPDLLAAIPGLGRRVPPVVWDVHEDTAAALVDRPWVPGPMRRPAHWAVRGAERLAERRIHLLLAEDRYQERFRRTHPIIRNVPWWHDGPVAEVERRVVMVGRLSRARGVHEALEAGRRLADHGITVELMGAADAGVADEVAAADREGWVRHLGFVPNAEALQRTEGALAGLSLHHAEPNYAVSLPGKVLEYLMRGVPPVATPLPLVEEFLTEHGCGVIVEAGSADDVVEAVLTLDADRDRRAEMVANGREALRTRCWEHEAERLIGCLSRWADC